MRPAPAVPQELRRLLAKQHGAVTTQQASASGLSERQMRTLVSNGWTRPTRGVLIEPEPRDPFRASAQAALLAAPGAALCNVTAARLHDLWGLPIWTPLETPHVIFEAGRSWNRRKGINYHSGLRPDQVTTIARLRVTTLARTVTDMAGVLSLDDLVCLLDKALADGWEPVRPNRALRRALLLADQRSESPLETRLRLLLVRAGLAPETLQLKLFDRNGRLYARLDMAWPSRRLAVEADGRAVHDAPEALYKDRGKGNALGLDGWTVLRFTWLDLVRRPYLIIEQVRRALTQETVVKPAV